MAVDVTVETDIRRPAVEVFNYLADGEHMPDWMDEFDIVIQTSSGPASKGTTYKYRMRRGSESTFEWSEFEPGRKLAWRGPPIKGTLGSLAPNGSYTLTERDGSTHVAARFRPELGGAMKLARPLVARSLRRVFRGDFERLRKILEESR
jgi:uncharacterized protein YndB with AHSA1/START domain